MSVKSTLAFLRKSLKLNFFNTKFLVIFKIITSKLNKFEYFSKYLHKKIFENLQKDKKSLVS